MKPQIHPQWAAAIMQAEQELAKNLPSVYAARQADPNWRSTWPQHRSLQISELAEWCLTHMPKVILELGSGWTTLVMARYAAEFRAKLVTVEEDSKWREEGVMKLLPSWAQVHWFMSPVVTDGDNRRYQELPGDLPEIDLLYVDGPNCDYMGRTMTGGDAVRLVESGVRPKHILFDMRKTAVDLFRDVDGYGFEPGGSYKWAKPWYLRPLRHHSWFWRK